MAKPKPSQSPTLVQNPKTEFNPKALDILLKYLEQTLKNADTNILLAFTIAAFLLIPGLEGTFSVETRDAAVAEIPYLNFQAQLLTAAIFGLVLYWVFCLRAAFQVSRARTIAEKLKSAGTDILEAALHFPSVATSTILIKSITCFLLALLNMISWILIYRPSLSLGDSLWVASFMAIPPIILLSVMRKPLNSPISDP